MKVLEQLYKLWLVTIYLLRQYANIVFSPKQAKLFFTETYIKAIEHRKKSTLFGDGLTRVSLNELFPKIEHQPLKLYSTFNSLFNQRYSREDASLVSSKELMALTALVSYLKPQSIFEFGTYRGWTLANLIANAGSESHVKSLDQTHWPSNDLEVEARLVQKNVQLIKANSQTFDFSLFHSRMDFIFIDADHEKAAVAKDTENAFLMLADKGVIVWHDYNPEHPGCFEFLHELSKNHRLFSIKNTALVIYIRE